MFILATFRIVSFRTLPFIPQKKIRIKFSANYPLTTFRIPNIPLAITVRVSRTNRVIVMARFSFSDMAGRLQCSLLAGMGNAL